MTDLIGKRLGEFEILSVLGRGGMGVVYEAVQTSLNRRVALKVLGPGLGLTPRAVDRFKREAEAAARLHHTNIVPVYATGEQDGIHFYAMELIDGPGLDVVIRQLRERQSAPARSIPADLAATGPYVTPDPLTPTPGSAPGSGSSAEQFDRVAAIVADAADALHHAHQSGVTHRDVKPSNLLLAADGRVRVTDFGLARMLEQPGMTVTGEFVGTPAYMSPEQITAGRVLVDHRTDVYSLGATLYELLTLRPPFVAEGRDRLLAMVIQKDPPSVRSIESKVPKDLETICLKALDKDPDRRYQSAGDMAEDLRRFLNRFAILAKRAGPLARAAKWAKRNPAVAGLIAVTLVAAGAVGVFAYDSIKSKQLHKEEQTQIQDELKREKRDRALETAVMAAISGNLAKAEYAIGQMEAYGASTSQIFTLRGQVAFFKGDLETALACLQQAIKMDPNSTLAKSMLAVVFLNLGDWKGYEAALNELSKLTPNTVEEHIFQGYAYSWSIKRDSGLKLLDDAVKRSNSPIARAIRADTKQVVAESRASVELIEQSIADIDQARDQLPDNPFILSVRVNVFVVAANIYRHKNLPDKLEYAKSQASADAAALVGFESMTFPFNSLYTYYEFTKEHDKLDALLNNVVEVYVTPVAIYGLALSHYEASRLQKALQVLDHSKRKDRNQDHLRVFVLAEQHPNDLRPAREAFESMVASESTGLSSYEDLHCLCFLGFRAEAIERCRKLREKQGDSAIHSGFNNTHLNFFCGQTDEKPLQVLRHFSLNTNSSSSFYIAINYLADGDRATAVKYFKEGTKYPLTVQTQYFWSKAFLSRMEKDPTWPAWIRAKK